ncbi:MAG: helix-turn-helix domain-containing protein [Oscillospiraceae bacterium]|jgi:YesN/AraC family two-component response regulator|nr:helix-turn-helix domain-containing protein [Oscillospiraceae bacterium]
MTPELFEECEKYRQHFTDLLEIGCKIVDLPDKSPAYISPKDDLKDFCTHCTFGKNKGLTTHLYGCHEAHRWNGKYIYYCPLGLTFIAASVSDNEGSIAGGIVIGPIVMGDAQDVLYDLPDTAMTWAVSQLSAFSTQKVRHISAILSAVTVHIMDENRDKRENPPLNQEKLLYEINVAKDNYNDVDAKNAEMLLKFESELHLAMLRGEKSSALEMINEVLAHIYVYGNSDVRAIKARLLELLVILSRATIEAGADPAETFRLSEDFFLQIEQYADVDQLALWISDIVRRFILQAFDLAQVKHSDVIFKTSNYIKKNCAEKLSLDSLAREVFLSKSYLSSIFKRETGVSLTTYITKVRVEKSKKLLLEDNASLAHISSQCGFKDQSYFTKVFKKATGVSPKYFRDNYYPAAGK